MELIIELAEAELDEVSGGLISFSNFSVRQNARGGDSIAIGGNGDGGDGGRADSGPGGFGGFNLVAIVDASESTPPDA